MNEYGRDRTLYAIGECMVEFSPARKEEYQRSFAGDVYNAAVYLKRLAPPDCNVEFVSAAGDDALSTLMMQMWRGEGILTNHVAVLTGASPGLYVVDTDDTGERYFSYWRSQSAARELTIALKTIDKDALRQGDYIYYSGVTLAILSAEDRELLFDFIGAARLRGLEVSHAHRDRRVHAGMPGDQGRASSEQSGCS